MPYVIDKKEKCVYKENPNGSRGKKVGCTKGNLNDYVAALQMHHEGRTNLKESVIPGAIDQLYAVQKPYSGCEPSSMIKPVDPIMGLGNDFDQNRDSIHAVFADPDMANDVANELYEEYLKKEQALEEKKGSVTDKIKKAIDKLEKKRKEHMDLAKEDPKSASQHRDHIAQIMDKVDDFMVKLEKIEKSKKEVEKDKKDKEKEKK